MKVEGGRREECVGVRRVQVLSCSCGVWAQGVVGYAWSEASGLLWLSGVVFLARKGFWGVDGESAFCGKREETGKRERREKGCCGPARPTLAHVAV